MHEKTSKHTDKPLHLWLAALSVGIAIAAASLGDYLLKAYSEDQSGITLSIAILFCTALIASFFHILMVSRQMKIIKKLIHDNPFGDRSYDWARHEVTQLMSISYLGSQPVVGENLLTPYRSRLYQVPHITSMTSSILITLGLIGTVIGLIGAVAGLSEVINNTTRSEDSLFQGVQNTILSMGTAFYTTLFGAFLGGLMLKALSKMSALSIDRLIGILLEQVEFNNAKINEHHTEENTRQQMLQLLIEQHKELSVSTSALSNSFNLLKTSTEDFTKHLKTNIELMLNSRITKLSNDLKMLSESLESFGRDK